MANSKEIKPPPSTNVRFIFASEVINILEGYTDIPYSKQTKKDADKTLDKIMCHCMQEAIARCRRYGNETMAEFLELKYGK